MVEVDRVEVDRVVEDVLCLVFEACAAVTWRATVVAGCAAGRRDLADLRCGRAWWRWLCFVASRLAGTCVAAGVAAASLAAPVPVAAAVPAPATPTASAPAPTTEPIPASIVSARTRRRAISRTLA